MAVFRAAFLTSEFISEKRSGGGLGNYLNRITQALKQCGHQPEVFVVSAATPTVIDFNGIRVERLPLQQNLPLKLFAKLQTRLNLFPQAPWGGPHAYLAFAHTLAQGFLRRHRQHPFDFVQSTNCHASGLFLPRSLSCPHLVRLSSKRDLWFGSDGRTGRGAQWMIALERRCIRRADMAYAPSQFLADQCRQDRWRADVQVLRPPIFLDTQPQPQPPCALPQRYLIHFGQFGERKGSFALARALCQVWQHNPEVKMVWAGRPICPGDYEYCHRLWGNHAPNVLWLGALEKSALYTVLSGAIAAVLPSKIDNLPNTAIESLMLNVPVIGFNGGSIDELVEPNVSGTLVPMDDTEALATALIEAWNGTAPWSHQPFPPPPIFQSFQPPVAVDNLLRLAGLTPPPTSGETP